MELPKFFPLVLEIVIFGDGNQNFIVRNTNGNVISLLHDTSEISSFIEDICKKMEQPVSAPDSVSQSNLPH